MIEPIIKSISDKYPDVKPLLTGYAAWLLMEDELRKWEAKAISRANAGDTIVCDSDSEYIPDGVKDMVKMMLSYADCENCVKVAFSDVLAFVKKSDDRVRYEKIPYTGEPYIYTPGDIEITEKDITQAIRTWNKLMPDYAGMLDAKVEAST